MHHQLSLSAAILISINVMLGTGLFINSVPLAQIAGCLGFAAYALVGILLLPLIIIIAQLIARYPEGGFYTFGAQELHPFIGFMSAWVYFAGKIASAALMIHASTLFLQTMLPPLAAYNALFIDSITLLFFMFLNMSNTRISHTIQILFFCAKLIPIAVLFMIVLSYFSTIQYTYCPTAWNTLITALPLVLYATIGFETACSLSNRIHNASVNGPRAVLISYGLLVTIYCLFQGCLSVLFGPTLSTMQSFTHLFTAIASYMPSALQTTVALLLSGAVAISALGGAYGILFSNIWNLHALARHNHVWFSSWFSTLNKNHVPRWCIIAEIALCSTYLMASHGAQLPLQQIGALGSVVAYTVSCCAALAAHYRGTLRSSWILIITALINCLILATICTTYLLQGGNTALYIFFGMHIIGICMFFTKQQPTTANPCM
jgi:amino acid transporter